MIEIVEYIDGTGESKILGKMNELDRVPIRNDLINLKSSVYMVISVAHLFGVRPSGMLTILKTIIKVNKLCDEGDE